jgi:hypothetical protein
VREGLSKLSRKAAAPFASNRAHAARFPNAEHEATGFDKKRAMVCLLARSAAIIDSPTVRLPWSPP